MDENLGGAPLLSKSHSNCPAKVGGRQERLSDLRGAWRAAGRQVGGCSGSSPFGGKSGGWVGGYQGENLRAGWRA